MGTIFAAGGLVVILFVVLTICIVAGCIFLAVRVAGNLSATAASKAGNDAFQIVEIGCKVLTKRTQVWGADQSNTTYYATFDTDYDARLEFKLPEIDYGMITEGDIGSLKHQGTRFIGFTRDLHAQQIVLSTAA